MEQDPKKFLIELRELCRVSPSRAIDKIDTLIAEEEEREAAVHRAISAAQHHEIMPEPAPAQT